MYKSVTLDTSTFEKLGVLPLKLSLEGSVDTTLSASAELFKVLVYADL